jgi:hypothetical protein
LLSFALQLFDGPRHGLDSLVPLRNSKPRRFIRLLTRFDLDGLDGSLDAFFNRQIQLTLLVIERPLFTQKLGLCLLRFR